LYGDLNVDVRTGAELLNKKLKEVIVVAMNSGNFTAEACVPVFARFVYVRNKATKRLTLDWLQELNEKLIGAPILEFLHLFLGGIFDMIADPTPVSLARTFFLLCYHTLTCKALVRRGVTHNFNRFPIRKFDNPRWHFCKAFCQNCW